MKAKTIRIFVRRLRLRDGDVLIFKRSELEHAECFRQAEMISNAIHALRVKVICVFLDPNEDLNVLKDSDLKRMGLEKIYCCAVCGCPTGKGNPPYDGWQLDLIRNACPSCVTANLV